ncbi:hypothetical protein CW751_13980 [Brumimicrobium salinarum]|uniref:SCO family protein n=1 Tax=Brumimicrobium salinarum TaxID=2058658 RepID=A0A2I0QZB5_9FLAO|nr:SCO family protein [Brumimicrobium salinarum]PKR79673.1 hypothetical protein CW751_13980 [Brumimicrobium salinarum]
MTKQKKNKINFDINSTPFILRNLKVIPILLVFLFYVSCEDQKSTSKEVDLPFIGHHDIAFEETEEYKVGDTIFHTVPSWTYLTQDSIMLSSDEIDDQIWIADFFFSYCPTICPPMTKAMRELTDSLSQYRTELTFLSFSIDPDRDTPSRLRLYRDRHDATAENWYFLTGDEAATHRLGIDGFQLFANADENAPGGFAHSSNFVLIDKNQHIRGLYDGLDPESRSKLIHDAKLLLDGN